MDIQKYIKRALTSDYNIDNISRYCLCNNSRALFGSSNAVLALGSTPHICALVGGVEVSGTELGTVHTWAAALDLFILTQIDRGG